MEPKHRSQCEQLEASPNGILPSEYTQQPPFPCHCGNVLSLGGGRGVETKPSHGHSFPKELWKQGEVGGQVGRRI